MRLSSGDDETYSPLFLLSFSVRSLASSISFAQVSTSQPVEIVDPVRSFGSGAISVQDDEEGDEGERRASFARTRSVAL